MKWGKINGFDYKININGDVVSIRNNIKIKPYISNGYLKVDLYNNYNRRKAYIHQLVCETFHKSTHFKDAIVNHKDGDRLNNNVKNLEWSTYSLNNKHAYEVLGKKCIRPSGAKSPHAKKIIQMDMDGNKINEFGSIVDAQNKYGGCVERCLSGRNKTAYGFKWKYA